MLCLLSYFENVVRQRYWKVFRNVKKKWQSLIIIVRSFLNSLFLAKFYFPLHECHFAWMKNVCAMKLRDLCIFCLIIIWLCTFYSFIWMYIRKVKYYLQAWVCDFFYVMLTRICSIRFKLSFCYTKVCFVYSLFLHLDTCEESGRAPRPQQTWPRNLQAGQTVYFASQVQRWCFPYFRKFPLHSLQWNGEHFLCFKECFFISLIYVFIINFFIFPVWILW